MTERPLALFDFLQDIGRALFSFVTEAATVLFVAKLRFDVAVDAAESIARRYRWCLSTNWSLRVVMTLGKMADAGIPYQVFEHEMISFYASNNWREVAALIESTCEYESVSPLRRKILRDTVLLIRAGERDGFNAASFAVPTLFAQLEGLLRDFAHADLGLGDGPGKTITVRQITPALHAIAARVARPSLDIISNLLYASYRTKNPPKGQRFARNLFNHGRAIQPGRISYIIRLLLMIDQIAYLIDKYRGVESEAVHNRLVWSEWLSASADQAHLSKSILEQRGRLDAERATSKSNLFEA